jgi:hypothetical protein
MNGALAIADVLRIYRREDECDSSRRSVRKNLIPPVVKIIRFLRGDR